MAMEEDYNIFGSFENLSSVNIAKKLNFVPPNNAPAKETTVSEEDFLLEMEKDIFPKNEKSSRKTSSTKPLKSTESKEKESTKANSLNTESKEQESPKANSLNNTETSFEVPAAEQSIARRTRSSSRASLGTPIAASNAKSTSKRKTQKNSGNPSSSSIQSVLSNAMGILNTTRPKRGGKKSKGSANSVNPTPSVDTVVILEDESANNAICSLNPGNSQNGGISNGRNRSVMRARRNFIAERAARCTTVDFVDLISSPLPQIKGVIDVSLDSDDEKNKSPNKSTVKSSALETSFGEDNPEISVKIVWDGVTEVFPLRKYQKFEYIFELLAERAETEKDKVFLNLDNKIITPTDTPASINYKIFQFIYGRAMIDPKFLGASVVGKKKRDRNLLILKVQSDKWKRPLSIELHKTEKFKKLIIKCAEELKMPYEKVKLSFDGEPLQNDQTPIDLEFEGGEILDIHLNDNVECAKK